MSYSVVRIQGKQHKVSPGDKLTVDRLPNKEGETISLDEVLLQVDGSKVSLGKPYLNNVSLKAKVLEHIRGEKIRVATYKAKSRYRRVIGHRQAQSVIEFTSAKLVTSKTSSSTKPASKPAANTSKSK